VRVLLLSKACVVGIYQSKLEEMVALDNDLDLTLAVPPFWRDQRGRIPLEKTHTQGYTIKVMPMALNGYFHIHFYPGFSHLIRDIKPHIVHIDEEPYNLATYLANIAARKSNAKTLWFSWQNLERHYPPPFSWIERYNIKHIDYAIAGSQTSAQIWRTKGYQGPLAIIPQFGVDPSIFSPSTEPAHHRPVHIAYAGRFVEEKGIELLIQALSGLKGLWHATLLGSGPAEKPLKELAGGLGLLEHITFKPTIPSSCMPDFYRGIDILVLPSRTKHNWKEQFGRVLVEAMSCGVCVIGSDSGEIPHVIGDAGFIFPEGHLENLRGKLQYLINNDNARKAYAEKGRQRVLDKFTQNQVAQATLRVYRELTS
jgi:glycosyltransferase involved in cell wall biosynthesis